jgi:hypothetical protein
MVQKTAFNAENLSLLPSIDWMGTLGAVKAGACLVIGGPLDTFKKSMSLHDMFPWICCVKIDKKSSVLWF